MDWLMLAAVFCAYFVKGLCGFANTLVLGTMLAFRADNVDITPLDLLLGLPANIVIAVRERRSLSARVWLPLAGLVVAGNIPGVLLLKSGSGQGLKVFFGLVVMALAVEMLLRERQKTPARSHPALLAAIGLLSGLLCGLFGIGALLAAYVGRTASDSRSFRGNLCMVFVTENLFRLVAYSATGIITPAVVTTALRLAPVMLAGLACGLALSRMGGEAGIRRFIMAALGLSGLSLVATNLTALLG